MVNRQKVNNHHYDLSCLGQISNDILNYDHLSPPIGMNDGVEKHLSSTTNLEQQQERRKENTSVLLSFSQGIFGLSLLVTQVVCMGVGGEKKEKKRKPITRRKTDSIPSPMLPANSFP